MNELLNEAVSTKGFVLNLRDRRKSLLDSVTMCEKNFFDVLGS
jgi:hypothetical protein